MKAIIIATLLALSASANAQEQEEYTFSYTFNSGPVITGSLEGVAHGDVVSNITDFAVNLNGVPIPPAVDIYGAPIPGEFLAYSASDFTPGGAQMSFDGKQNNFFFINGVNQLPDGYNPFLFLFGGEGQSLKPPGAPAEIVYASSGEFQYPQGAGDVPPNDSWSLSPHSEHTSVPEPSTFVLALFAGVALFGFRSSWLRRVMARSSL